MTGRNWPAADPVMANWFSIGCAIWVLAAVPGCNSELAQDNAALKAEIERLRAEVAAKDSEIETLHGAPAYLYAQAVQMKQQGRYRDARNAFTDVIDQHPASSEAKDAQDRVTEIDQVLQEIAQRKQEQEEQRQAEAARRRAAQEARTQRIRQNVVSKRDDVEGITWHYPKNQREKDNGSWSWTMIPPRVVPSLPSETGYVFCPYIGQKGTSEWMKLYVGFRGYDWLFLDEVIVLADTRRFRYAIPYSDRESEVISGSNVKEWAHLTVDDTVRADLAIIAAAKDVTVRFTGKYYRDVTLGIREKQAIQTMLDYHSRWTPPGRP